tara:strand:+ start:352 stop:609 length:258 start_codon:yes stop_codon:yes gene_type:complete
MVMFINVAVKFVADFFSGIINGIANKWLQMRESRKRGKAEAENDAHKEIAKRKAKSDKVLEQPVKTGKSLVASKRKRAKSKPADK